MRSILVRTIKEQAIGKQKMATGDAFKFLKVVEKHVSMLLHSRITPPGR